MKVQLLNEHSLDEDIFIISDLHISCPKDTDSCIKFVDRLDAKCNYIFIVGDIFDSTNYIENVETFKSTVRLFNHLANIAPVYFVSGNHDLVGYKGKRRVKSIDLFRKFASSFSNDDKITFLDNKTVELKPGLTVSGITMPVDYLKESEKAKWEYLFKNDKKYDFLKCLDKENTNIVLCHYPNVVFELNNLDIATNVDIFITGHNHNGMTQIKFFPLEKIFDFCKQKNRGIITPTKSFKLKDTKTLRGVVNLKGERLLIINPAFKSLSKASGFLSMFNCLFYKGYTIVELRKK